MIGLNVSQLSVAQKISSLTRESDRKKFQTAYSYLMNSETSAYCHFINLRDKLVAGDLSFNAFDMDKTQGIECALWPNLYLFTEWCESMLCGKASQLSVKVAFMAKVMSELLDYSQHFDLLQLHYDRWMYKVVSAAINTARISNCSPARALDSKTFSPTYWHFLMLLISSIGQMCL